MTHPEDPGLVQTIELIHDHSLEIRRSISQNVLRVVSLDGRAGISITVSDRGITVNVSGGDLTLQTSGALSIDAEKLSLHGREGVVVSSGGDASLRVVGDFDAEARIHNIRASLGNVNVRANDDVCLDGERIRLNSPNLRQLTPKRAIVETTPYSPDEES